MMGSIPSRILLHLLATLMLMGVMKNLNSFSSLSKFPTVVAFDATLVSNALTSFVIKGGDTHSFDLIICLDFSHLSDLALEEILVKSVSGFRVQLTNCSSILPPSSNDHHQILYIIFPGNKTGVRDIFWKIEGVYKTTKETFYSSHSSKLLWMPLFLIIWPDKKDYCRNMETSKHLVRASLAGEKMYKSFVVDSDVYIFLGSSCQKEEDNVWEIYSVSEEEDSLITQKLLPDRRKHESMFEGILGRVRRRRNLSLSKIRAVASRDPSSFLEGPSRDLFDPLEIIDGTPRVVFRELVQALNLTAEITVGDWISRYPNGTMKGFTVTLFRKGLADLLISQTSLLPYRKVELSFLQPTYSNSINGFFVQPAASSFRDIVIAPFTFGLWISLFITYLILILSILYFVKEYGKVFEEDGSETDFTFKDEVLLWAVGALTQQGWHIWPQWNPTRMAFTLGYFLGLLCYGAFSAAVVSILAVEMIPIKTRSDLLSSSLNFYADNASSTMAYIVDYLRQHTSIKFGNRVGIKEGVARLQSSEPSCYIAFPHYFYLSAGTINISESWICNHLSVIPVTMSGTPSSMVVPRDSPYAELLNFMILKMISRGLNYRYIELYNEVTTAKCSKQAKEFFRPLAVQDVFTACLILLAGTILGIGFLCLEKMRKYMGSRKKEKVSFAIGEHEFYDEHRALF